MSTRQRRRSRPDEAEQYDDEFGFVTDDDIEAYMAEQELEEETEAEAGFWNLQTASGMGLIGLGALYSLQLLNVLPFGSELLFELVQILPIFAAILIMLTGFGVLSWSPAARRRRKARERAARRRRKARREPRARKTVGRAEGSGRRATRAFEQAERALRAAGRTASRAGEEARARRAAARRAGHRRLVKNRRNRKLTGVAAGMADYFGLDPTVVRIAWVVATIFTNGGAILPYILLSLILSADDDDGDDPVVRVKAD